MGLEVCKAVDAADDLELVAMVDQGDWLFNASDAGAQVLVDFTTPDVVMDNLHWAIDQGINMVVGTTGFTEQRLDRVRGWLSHKPDVGVLIAPNFGIGARADDAVRRAGRPATSSRSRSSSSTTRASWTRRAAPPTHTAQLIAAARAEPPAGRRCPTPPRRSWPARAAPTSTASGSIPCAPPAWWPTRRSCSAPRARR